MNNFMYFNTFGIFINVFIRRIFTSILFDNLAWLQKDDGVFCKNQNRWYLNWVEMKFCLPQEFKFEIWEAITPRWAPSFIR